MNNTKISVIIPVYNTEEFIEECLNSVLNQTLKEIEVICVNDGSTDNSLSVLKSIEKKDSRVKVFDKENGGSGSARNLGLEHAKGEYIAFLDSDDYLINDNAYLEMYEGAITENVVMVSANLQAFTPERIIKETRDLIQIKERSLKKTEEYGKPWYFPKNIFKREFLNKYNIIFPNLKRGQDPAFLSKVLANTDYYLELPIDYYSYRTPQVNRINTFEKYYDYFKGFYEVFDILIPQSRFNEVVCLYFEKLANMKNREICIYNKDQLLKIIKIMDNLKNLFIKFNDENILKELTSSFNELISQVCLECIDIFVYEPYDLYQEYSHNVFVVNYNPNDFLDNKPKISVIIPVYNVEEFLGVTINSVLKQTFEDIEIICVDDCSSDSSSKLLEFYSQKDNRIKVIKNEINSSLGFSRNAGMKRARGKYIFFLDSDDWINTDTLEKLYNKAEKDSLDLLIFKTINFDDEKRLFYPSDWYDMEFLNKFENTVFTHWDLGNNDIFRMQETAWNKLYLKSFLDDINLQFPVRLIHEDNPSFIEVICNAKRVSLIDEYLINRRRRQGSITTRTGKEVMDIIPIIDKIIKIFVENEELYNYYKSYLLNRFIGLLKNKYDFIDIEFKDEFFNQTQSLLNKFYLEYGLYEDIHNYVNKDILEFFN